jgi:hypothetical protein
MKRSLLSTALVTGLLVTLLFSSRPGHAACITNDTALCLNASRFQLSANWTTATSSGVGHAVQLTPDTGYFWFFNPNNVELIVKVLNGCSINNHYWVFAGGLTNVKVDLSGLDSESGALWRGSNPANTPFNPIQDTAAFPCGATSSPQTVGGFGVAVPAGWRMTNLPETLTQRAVLTSESPLGSAVVLLPKGGSPDDFDPDTQLMNSKVTLAGHPADRTDYADSTGVRFLSRIVFDPPLQANPSFRVDVHWKSNNTIEESLVERTINSISLP